MRVLICGSRNWTDIAAIEQELKQFPENTTIIHGGARGADHQAGIIAQNLNFIVVVIPPDWETYGRGAGFRRNLQMLDLKPDLVVAFHKGRSPGTGHTINEARKRGITTKVIRED